jgi:predicted nucleotidyltransferase
MKLTLKKLKEVVKENEAELRDFGIKSLAVFGSVARGEANNKSDVDILVEFDRPVGIFHFLDLKYFLETILKTQVDLATRNALHPMLKSNILKEAVRVA